MKATIEFDLPEERCEMDLALNGWKYECVLEAIWLVFRNENKHGDGEKKYTAEEVMEIIREKRSERDI